MANEKKGPQQPPQQHPAQQMKTQLTPREYRDKMVAEDIVRLQSGGYRLVQQKTKDTAETRNFINTLDDLAYKARLRADTPGSKITFDDLQKKFMPRIREAKEQLNLLCAELSALIGEPYRPPRGYDHPLKKHQQPTPQKQKQQKRPNQNPEPTVAAAVTEQTQTLAVPSEAKAEPLEAAMTA